MAHAGAGQPSQDSVGPTQAYYDEATMPQSQALGDIDPPPKLPRIWGKLVPLSTEGEIYKLKYCNHPCFVVLGHL